MPQPRESFEAHHMFFDSERLSLVADNAAEKTAILKLFFHEANWYCQQMRYALQYPDTKLYKEAAHSLRGSASNMGMYNLASLCDQAIQKEQGSSKERKNALGEICREIHDLKEYAIKQKLLLPHV